MMQTSQTITPNSANSANKLSWSKANSANRTIVVVQTMQTSSSGTKHQTSHEMPKTTVLESASQTRNNNAMEGLARKLP